MSNIAGNKLDQKPMKRRRGHPSSSPETAKQGPEQPNVHVQAFDYDFYLQTTKHGHAKTPPPLPSPSLENMGSGQPQLPGPTLELDFPESLENSLDDNKEIIERKEFVKSFSAALLSADNKIMMDKDTLQSMLNNFVMSGGSLAEAQMREEREELEAKMKKLETELESMTKKYEEEKLHRTTTVKAYEAEKEARSELLDELVKATHEIQALKHSEKALEDDITKLKQYNSSRWNEAEKYASTLLRLCYQNSTMDNLSPERNQPLMLENSKAMAVGTQTPPKHEGINCGSRL